jgi:hypothetical protein
VLFDSHVFTNATVVMPMVVAMLAPTVMAVDPMMAMLRPMAGHPDHLPFAIPVMRAVAVVWPVADFDAKSLRLNGGPESEARRDSYEQQYFLNHITESVCETLQVAPAERLEA